MALPASSCQFPSGLILEIYDLKSRLAWVGPLAVPLPPSGCSFGEGLLSTSLLREWDFCTSQGSGRGRELRMSRDGASPPLGFFLRTSGFFLPPSLFSSCLLKTHFTFFHRPLPSSSQQKGRLSEVPAKGRIFCLFLPRKGKVSR